MEYTQEKMLELDSKGNLVPTKAYLYKMALIRSLTKDNPAYAHVTKAKTKPKNKVYRYLLTVNNQWIGIYETYEQALEKGKDTLGTYEGVSIIDLKEYYKD